MEIDLFLLKRFEEQASDSTIRIYSWRPKCVSVGYSQSIEEEIDLKKAKSLGWDIVKRPTGGGIVFHNEAEVTYSLVTAIDNPILPKGLIPSYKKISEAIVLGLKELGVAAEISSPRPSTHFVRSGHPSPSEMERGIKGVRSLCFSYPAEYEIVVDKKKIVGSAQKRGRKALLQQGSIFVQRTEASALTMLKKPYEDINAMSVEEALGREVAFDELSDALVDGFVEVLGVKFN